MTVSLKLKKKKKLSKNNEKMRRKSIAPRERKKENKLGFNIFHRLCGDQNNLYNREIIIGTDNARHN
jgi:hypothetical protein